MAPSDMHRRESDKWANKLSKYGGVVVVCATILYTTGSFVWANKDDVNSRLSANEKDITEMKTDIKYIIKMMETNTCGNRR